MSLKLPKTASFLEEVVDTNVKESFDSYRETVEWESYNEIYENKLVGDKEAKIIDIKYTIYGGKAVCRVQLCRNLRSNVTYIRWIRVCDKSQGKGVGSLIYEEVCDKFADSKSKIYIKPVVSDMNRIAKKHDFVSADEMYDPWLEKHQ